MKINKRSIIYLIYTVINIFIAIVTVITLFYPSLFYLSTSTSTSSSSSLSSEEELAIRVMSCIGGLFFLAMAMASLLNFHEAQHVENETSAVVICNSFTQYSEVMDQPPLYLEVIEMDKLPSYSEAVETDKSNFDSRTC